MFRLGPWELAIILIIVIAIFGAGKLAGLGGALGKGVKDFRFAVKESEKDEDEDKETEEAAADSKSKAKAAVESEEE